MVKKRRILLGIALLVIGAWAGFEFHSELEEKGCLWNAADLTALNPKLNHPQRVRMLIFGDQGSADALQYQVADAMTQLCSTKGCDFALVLGDNFYENGVLSVDDPLWERAYHIPYQNLDIPFYAVMGNHDYRGDIFAQVAYSLIDPNWKMPSVRYQFETPVSQFFGINSNCQLLEMGTLNQQLDLDKSLQKWIIVFGHHPIYSSGTHGDGETLFRGYWKQWIADDVDFYFAGHDHHLEHLRHAEQNTEYIISGAAGKSYHDHSEEDFEASDAESLFQHTGGGFVWMELTEENAKVEFYDESGKQIYQFEKEKPPRLIE